MWENASLAGTLYSVIAGGANSSWSLFAMGIGPYINASIIMQLLTIAIPKFEQLSKEGPDGRKKLQSYSRYLTVVLALIQGTCRINARQGDLRTQSDNRKNHQCIQNFVSYFFGWQMRV